MIINEQLTQIFFKISKCEETSDRSVSLMPICGKIIERLVFEYLFEFFFKNKLISSNHSTFKQCGHCIC